MRKLQLAGLAAVILLGNLAIAGPAMSQQIEGPLGDLFGKVGSFLEQKLEEAKNCRRWNDNNTVCLDKGNSGFDTNVGLQTAPPSEPLELPPDSQE